MMIYLTQYLSGFCFAFVFPVVPPMCALNLQIYFFLLFLKYIWQRFKVTGFLLSSEESLGSKIQGQINRDGAMAQRKVAAKQGVRKEEEAEK